MVRDFCHGLLTSCLTEARPANSGSCRKTAYETFVRNIVTGNIKPPLPVIIEKLTLSAPAGELPVLRIVVPRSLFVHESPSGYLHRVGSSRRKMSPEYLFRLGQQRSQARIIRFDEQTVPKATLDDLDEPLWKRFRTERSSNDSRDVFLTKLGMAARDEDATLRPTIAGILLASSQDPLYQLDAADLTGPLDQQIAEAFRFVMRNMRTFATKHTGRTDIPQYDAIAVFEALVNAVAHRDYSIHGSKIRLRMFSDRLELYSPSALPNTMSVDSMSERQASRNETITSLLARCSILHLTGFATERTTFMDRRAARASRSSSGAAKLSPGKRPSTSSWMAKNSNSPSSPPTRSADPCWRSRHASAPGRISARYGAGCFRYRTATVRAYPRPCGPPITRKTRTFPSDSFLAFLASLLVRRSLGEGGARQHSGMNLIEPRLH